MSFRKEINGTILDIALQWCLDRYSYTVLGYANRIRTIDGGTHIDGVKASITRIINSLAKESKAVKEKDINLSEDNVWEGLTCIVSVTVPNPEFEGQTKTKLGNLYVREIVDQSVHKYLAEYFELHPDILEIIITKSIYANKAAALAFKREKNLLRSKIVSMPCTIPEKLAYCSSDNSDIFIGKGDSSSSDANRDSQRRFQRKRTREQPGSDDAISTAFEGSIENTSNSNFEKKHKNQKFCVPSSSPSLSLKKPAETSARKPKAQDAHDKKRLEDVVHDSKKTRAVVPIGPGFQAEIPVWIAPTKKGAFYGSPGDSKTLKWLGTGVWPTYSLKDEVHYKDSDRLRSNSCSCASPGSTTCIKQHIKKAKDLLERGLRNAFYTWKFHEIGENVSKSWTAKEEQKFEELVKKNPLSSSEGFWEFAYKHFPQKSRKDLISYYHNVFLIKRMRMLSKSSDGHFDSDDDNYDDFLGR